MGLALVGTGLVFHNINPRPHTVASKTSWLQADPFIAPVEYDRKNQHHSLSWVR